MVKSMFFEMGNTLDLHDIPQEEEFLKEIEKYSPIEDRMTNHLSNNYM